MPGVVVFTDMYDEVLWRPGHLVNRWAVRMEDTLVDTTTAAAPKNKRSNKSQHGATYGGPTPVGFLKANISGSGAKQKGTRLIEFTVQSAAEYTMMVIRGGGGGTKVGFGPRARVRSRAGTYAPGTAGNAPYYKIPKNPGFGTRKRVYRFSGWAGNNFFEAGFDAAALKHPSLRG